MDATGVAVATVAASSGGEPPWVAITLAAIAVLGTLGTAYVPVMQERLRARAGGRPDPVPAVEPPRPTTAPPGPPPQEPFDLVEEAVADAFRQRDAALRREREERDRGDRMQTQIDTLRSDLAEARVRIAQLEARGRYG